MTGEAVPRIGHNQLVVSRHGPMLVNRHDIFVGRSVAVLGEYAKAEAEVLLQIVAPGDVVVEVGANIGSHTVPLAQRVGAGGAVWAFEPQRLVFQTLCANLALNSLTNVMALPCAVGAARGTARIPVFDPGQPGNFGGTSVGAEGEAVEVHRLDDYVFPRLALLKIDVEGMEPDVLRGGAATIARHRPVIYVENDRQAQAPGLIRQIAGMGYRLYWHAPALDTPEPFHAGAGALFPRVVSINMLCVHASRPSRLSGFAEVEGPEHWPFSAV